MQKKKEKKKKIIKPCLQGTDVLLKDHQGEQSKKDKEVGIEKHGNSQAHRSEETAHSRIPEAETCVVYIFPPDSVCQGSEHA